MTQGMSALSELTVSGIDSRLEREIRWLARLEGVSLSEAALHLLEMAVGLRSRPSPIGTSLDHLAGTWSDQETKEFLQTISYFDVIDPEIWD